MPYNQILAHLKEHRPKNVPPIAAGRPTAKRPPDTRMEPTRQTVLCDPAAA